MWTGKPLASAIPHDILALPLKLTWTGQVLSPGGLLQGLWCILGFVKTYVNSIMSCMYYNEILLCLTETPLPCNYINILMDSLYLRSEWVGLDDLWGLVQPFLALIWKLPTMQHQPETASSFKELHSFFWKKLSIPISTCVYVHWLKGKEMACALLIISHEPVA